jgi:hAT family C-terminal dimerisation region
MEYPILSQLAFDLLSVPAMAAGVERVFSGAKELITDLRNALDMESIQANEILQGLGYNIIIRVRSVRLIAVDRG